MPSSILRTSPVLLVAVILFAGSARAATKTIVLNERLGKKWTNELVSYPFTAAKGEATAASIRVTVAQQPVSVQFADVELWPNTQFIKSARLIFLVPDLEPGASSTYTISSAPAEMAASDLKVAPGEGFVEVGTSLFSARLLLGEKNYDPPAAPADVPGPLMALELPGGTWNGGSKFYGDLAVKGWSAKLVETGPVRARVQFRYILADDTAVTFDAELIAGDDKLLWEMNSSGDRPLVGVNFQLGKLAGLKQASVPKSWGQWGRPRTIAITAGPEPFANLGPNTSVANSFPDSPSAVILKGEGPELRLISRDPGAWADPKPGLSYGGYSTWNLDMIPLAWENWKRKRMPMIYGADGSLTVQANFAAGRRLWSVGSGEPVVGESLDWVKDLVLDWPEGKRKHPYLFMDQADIDAAYKQNPPSIKRVNIPAIPEKGINGEAVKGYLASGADADLTQKKVLPQLYSQLGALADYDVMRYGIAAAGIYDALIDSNFAGPADRKLLRAQMAYLGYKMADPMMWSIERGYHTGNPNMSISYTLTLGVVACAIPDHPMAKTWTDYANRWMDKWLTDEVGPNGEWIPEGSHYGLTSFVPLVSYAVAARRAGVHDFLSDPRFKKLVLFFAKQSTPRDPQWGNARTSPPVGRGTSSDTNGVYGILARATVKSDPEFSAAMQWLWAQENYPEDIGDWRLGGFESTYLDRSLPAKQPDWASEAFPKLGVVLRDGLGTPSENYVNVISSTDSTLNLDIWTPEIGNIAQWFAYGKQVSKQFTFDIGYKERHELLKGGVALARNGGGPNDPKIPFGYYTALSGVDFSALPRCDYATGVYTDTKIDDRDWFRPDMPVWPRVTPATAPTLKWTRQTMFVKDDAADGPHYLVLRDTTSGGQPTTWQFWTLSEKVGSADQAQATDFLADKPGQKILPARELPAGDRYTAVGQFGVDVDYYIASPTGTPRNTLRYGGMYYRVPEYQDVLHLQAPGDGAYFVALYPHPHGSSVPAFSTLAGGLVIKAAGDFGTDYSFLSPEAAAAKTEDVAFDGTAGSVQDRKGVAVLSLAAAGKVSYKQIALAAPVAAGLRVEAKSAAVSVYGGEKSNSLTLTLPGQWRLEGKVAGVELKAAGGGQYALTMPGGATTKLVGF